MITSKDITTTTTTPLPGFSRLIHISHGRRDQIILSLTIIHRIDKAKAGRLKALMSEAFRQHFHHLGPEKLLRG